MSTSCQNPFGTRNVYFGMQCCEKELTMASSSGFENMDLAPSLLGLHTVKPTLGIYLSRRAHAASSEKDSFSLTQEDDHRLLVERLRMTSKGFATVGARSDAVATSREIVRRPVNETSGFGWIAQEKRPGRCFPGRPVEVRSTGQPDWLPQIDHEPGVRACQPHS